MIHEKQALSWSAICLIDSFVFMLNHCVNFKAKSCCQARSTQIRFQTFRPGYMTNVMILISTLSIFHTFPATYHLALLMVCTFHSSLDMHDAAHTIMISDIATSAWLIDFCHKAI